MTKETQPLEVVASLPSGVDLPTPKVQGEFRKLATDTLNAANKALGLYRSLCAFIRSNQLHPYYVRKELEARGYAKPRIAEVIRISDSPAEIYKEFEDGELSFKASLQKLRQRNSGKNGETGNEGNEADAPRRTERDQLKYDLEGVLESYLPLVLLPGQKHKLQGLTVKFQANGWPCELKIGRKKGGAK